MKSKIFIFALLISLVLISITSANVPQQVCKVPSGVIQDPQGSPVPVISTIQNPVKLSSQTSGYKNTACGVATFGAAIQRSEVLDQSNNLLTQPSIINMCSTAVGLSPTNGGTFDQYLDVTKTILSKDPKNCYMITVKRLNSYTDAPILTLPTPVIQVVKNLKIITYSPYNFRHSDIISALQSVSSGKGGVGLGGVSYDSSNNVTAAHMFQPLGLNPNQRTLPNGEIRYDMKIYDPYFDLERNVEIAFDQQGRIYSNIWANSWFHLEELFVIQNLGPCINVSQSFFQSNVTNTSYGGGGSGLSGRTVKGPARPPKIGPSPPMPSGPTTPQGCGSLVPGATPPICSTPGVCPSNQYCSTGKLCVCMTAVCGDGDKAPSEQCDDGNTVDGDGCSATCKIETNPCAGVNPSISAATCNNPGRQCLYDGSFGLTLGICNSQCRCVWNEPI